MNFLFGAIILDCIANSNKETSENGASLLVSIGLFIYAIWQLPKIEQYILAASSNETALIGTLIAGFTILIPVYWLHLEKYKSIRHYSIWVSMSLRVMIYLDIFCGIAVMVIISNKIGQHPASYIFNIEKVVKYSQSAKVFLSFITSCGYIIIKILDFVSVVGLIPLIQVIFTMLIKKTIKLLLKEDNQSTNIAQTPVENQKELTIVNEKLNNLIEFDFNNRKYKNKHYN
ncbi:hypothetical protein GKZ28_08465 [Clostridium chromiireducens]|jgi:hypothetical protein|uniref:Uncharacterized protein n=1 Tax=Clostridium chromiireducens TaxID=225345 RepID=A0A964W243_9CLOT|nr:hypothetical protein [Clostridium chromiireducens]MVX63728.1 hypothetical protein [Clostridium chromiireducens]